MNHQEICHKFFNRIENKKTKTVEFHGKKVFCKDDKGYYGKAIYSYGSHFCMAFFDKYKGKNILFINTYSYSRSTGEHQGDVRQAINKNIVDDIIYCNFINIFNNNGNNSLHKNSKKKKKEFINIAKERIKELIENYNNSLKAIKHFSSSEEIEGILNNIKEFCKTYNLKIKFPEFDYEKLNQKIEKQLQRNKINADKASAKTKETNRLKAIQDYKNRCNKKFEYPYSFASLKIEDDKIRTSNYNSISIDNFKTAYRLFIGNLLNRKSLNDKALNIGNFQGVIIKANGICKVGCTKFFPDDIVNIARQLQIA